MLTISTRKVHRWFTTVSALAARGDVRPAIAFARAAADLLRPRRDMSEQIMLPFRPLRVVPARTTHRDRRAAAA